MKYYLFQKEPFQIQKDRWEILQRVEPSVVELTKEDYEKRMGIEQKGGEDQKAKDVGQPVGADTAQAAEASVLLGRQEAIKALRKKGYEWNELKTKTKGELNALL